MIKKALIIAPHPDDEINLAGQLMIYLKKKNIDIFVMYTTNGDAEEKIGNKRIQEAIDANEVLGIDKKHIIFLGYPNEWSGSIHIYNAEPELVLTSKLGKTQTNSIQGHPEFCMLKHNIHHSFTRNNFKRDYKEVIEYILPDLIIAPEFDSHPDHRTASLLFDEIMGEILKDKKDYRPAVLKKYIHEGVWYGPKDYYQMLPTQTEGPRMYCGGLHDLDSPSFTWNQRIQYSAEKETLTELISKNIIYKAAKKHKVTTAWYEMQRVINSDVIYWERRTDNLCLNANIWATSGNVRFLNDFKRYDCKDVKDAQGYFEELSLYCWIPDNEDERKNITIDFEKKTAIDNIVLFEDCSYKNHIKRLRLYTDDIEYIVEPDRSGAPTKVLFKSGPISRIHIQIEDWVGVPCISEIEVYSNNIEIPFANQIYNVNSFKQKKSISFNQKVEKMIFMLRFLFLKLRYEFTKRIINH